jgi:hypothetical protein
MSDQYQYEDIKVCQINNFLERADKYKIIFRYSLVYRWGNVVRNK